jgi:N-acyl-D-aspartate/D-glutamate deacylase
VKLARLSLSLLGVVFGVVPSVGSAAHFDLVIAGGRVIDPDSGSDRIANVGIRNGRIAAIEARALKGNRVLDARGLVVTPGFIDLHAHGQDTRSQALQALDGVTTAIDMEAGRLPINEYYDSLRGRAVINFGASVSQQCARQVVLDNIPCPTRSADNGSWVPVVDIRKPRAVFATATAAEVARIKEVLAEGLDQGGLGIGVGIEYTPGASRSEILQLFGLAAQRRAPIALHVRRRTRDAAEGAALAAAQEVVANAAATGAPTHLVHAHSTGLADTAEILQLVRGARQRGVDITTESYPYTAGSTRIGAAVFDPGWQERFGITYGDLQWVATGERLTEESFNRYRETQPSAGVILHMIRIADVDVAINAPDVIVASDGASWVTGGEHPRGAGTYARVLGNYVRDQGTLSLLDAVRKMSYLPAQRLAAYVPAMRQKGRLSVGADADLAVFDLGTVRDRATYEKPMVSSVGFKYVLVNGTIVVEDGASVAGTFPGVGVRRSSERRTP